VVQGEKEREKHSGRERKEPEKGSEEGGRGTQEDKTEGEEEEKRGGALTCRSASGSYQHGQGSRC
jgi:hypothetical protein